MSRSYKKTPWAGDKNNTYMKKEFNRKLRRQNKQTFDIENIDDDEDFSVKLSNSSYKKANQSWDIRDYPGGIVTWEMYWNKTISEWQSRRNRGQDEPYPDKDEEYKRWKKMYRQK